MAEDRRKKAWLNRMLQDIGYTPPAQTYNQRIAGEYMQPNDVMAQPGTAQAAEVEPMENLASRGSLAPAPNPVANTEYGSSLMAENRYPDQIVTSTTGGAGQQMRTTVSLGDNSISYAGGPRKLGRNRMYPFGKTTPRGGARRLKRGEVLMAPAETQGQTEGGAGDFSQLITREKAKEMGLGVNQWRFLNQQILENQGGLSRQQLMNVGASRAADIRGLYGLREAILEQGSPEARIKNRLAQVELDLAPLRERLLQSQADYYDRSFGTESESPTPSQRTVEDIVQNARLKAGY